jgi:hypothetical protein
MNHYLYVVLCRLYALSLRLYPQPFRAQFGEELRETFASLLDEVSTQGWQALIQLGSREVWHYPRSLTHEYRHAFDQRWQHASQRELNKIRWMTRGLSLFVLWFLVTVVWQGLTRSDPKFTPFVLMSAVTAICLSVAWWREHLGGWLTVHASLSMILALYIVALSVQGTTYHYLLNYFAMYLLYIVPSLITGVLFMSVSRAKRQPRSII